MKIEANETCRAVNHEHIVITDLINDANNSAACAFKVREYVFGSKFLFVIKSGKNSKKISNIHYFNCF